jgi:hypothetical protein
LPQPLFDRHSTFESFLTYGRSDEPRADLRVLTDDQFRAVAEFADIVCPDNRDVWAFTFEVRRRAGSPCRDGLADGRDTP